MLDDAKVHELLTSLRGVEGVGRELVNRMEGATRALDKVADELRKIDEGIRQYTR